LKQQYLLFLQDILEAIQKATVDYEMVWEVLKDDLSELKPKIKEIYESERTCC
jgi:uncharacterized protein with HEPN domain